MFLEETLNEIKEKCRPNQKLWQPTSKHFWIVSASNCMKGRIGKLLTTAYFESVGKIVSAATSVQHDLCVENEKLEIKLSCLNNTGMFKWLQIRIHDDYESLLLFGIYPDTIRAWMLDKKTVVQLADKEIILPQQGGKRNEQSKIMWLGINAFSIPEWLQEFEIGILT